jgi:excisionase family DNA binding protein
MGTDLSTWPNKVQTARIIGVSTKVVEKFVKQGKLQQQEMKRTGRPAIAVYHPEDVERVRVERNPNGTPFILPLETAIAERRSETSQYPFSEPSAASQAGALQLFAAALVKAMRPQAPAERGPRMMLVPEASEYSQIPQGLLRKMVKAGDLRHVMFRGKAWIRRSDLDAI